MVNMAVHIDQDYTILMIIVIMRSPYFKIGIKGDTY